MSRPSRAQSPDGNTDGVALQEVDEPPCRSGTVGPKIVYAIARDEATTGETAGTGGIGRYRNARDEVGERVVAFPLGQAQQVDKNTKILLGLSRQAPPMPREHEARREREHANKQAPRARWEGHDGPTGFTKHTLHLAERHRIARERLRES